MRAMILCGLVIFSSMAFAKSDLKVMCVEKSFAPNALRISVHQTGRNKLTLQKISADNSVNLQIDISDATYSKNGENFELDVNRGRSGSVRIEKNGDDSLVSINLFSANSKSLNMESQDFSCNGY